MADDILHLPKRGVAQAGQLQALKLAVFVLRPESTPFVTNHETVKIHM